MKQTFIAPKRKLIQWLCTLLVLGLPFVRVDGESLLRLDAPSRTLLFFGAHIRIEEFYLFLVASLILVFGFLFITMVFGRVWCGWLCPQTTMTDLAEFLDRAAERVFGRSACNGLVRHLLYLTLSAVMASNLIWYFISPYEFFPRLLRGEMGVLAGSTLIVLSILFYLNLTLVRRTFCRSVCPYGRIQLMTMDRNTLTLEFDRFRANQCIRCSSCVQVCPTGIDIRNGLQVECINCGRCLDACRTVMANKSTAGLIHYTFGRREEGGGKPLNARSLLLGGAILFLVAILAAGVLFRSEATIKVRRAGAGEVRHLADGAAVVPYTAYLENRTTDSARYDLTVQGPEGGMAELLGPVRGILIAPNENRRIDFLVKMPKPPPAASTVALVLSREGRRVAVAEALFPAR